MMVIHRSIAAIGLFSALLLGGCDKVKEWDNLRASQKADALRLSSTANDLATTKNQLAATRSDLAKLQIEIAVLKDRLAVLEGRLTKKVSNTYRAPRLAPKELAYLKEVIGKCVTAVRNSGKGEALQFLTDKFDAYYNEGSGLVQNNASGGAPAVFMFNKCMASAGIPLK